MQRLTVHIGGAKAGSSAIQRYLSLNLDTLNSDGILVPPQDFKPTSLVSGEHVWYFANLRKSGLRNSRAAFSDALNEVIGQSSFPVRQIIISAENLSDPLEWHELFVGLRERFELQIVFYVRRQDEFLLSAWKQWYAKANSDFWAWMMRNVGIIGNWQTIVEGWEKVVERANIFVRVYDRRRLVNGNITEDFRRFIATYKPLEVPPSNVNPSLNIGVAELVAGNRRVFESPHDNTFHELLSKISGEAHMEIKGQSPITFSQRQSILSRYEECNLWINKNYVKGETLFEALRPNEYITLGKEEIQKQKLDGLVDLIYYLYKSEYK